MNINHQGEVHGVRSGNLFAGAIKKMAVKDLETQKKKALSGKMTHRLAHPNVLPTSDEAFEAELKKLNHEIREWKEKSEQSIKGQISAKIGFRPDFSKEAIAENIKPYISDDIGHKHLKILKKDPQVYASRIAVAVSTIRKGTSLSDQALKKILIQAAAGNYNTEVKIDKNTTVNNISSVNLQVVIRAQTLYFDAFLHECKSVISGLLSKIQGIKDDVYKQQRVQIRKLIEQIQCNARIIQQYRHFVYQKQPDEKKRNILYNQDIVLNLNELEKENLDEKRVKVIFQQSYTLVRLIRHCPLLFPIGDNIAEKLIRHGKFKGKEHPMGYFLRAQIYADTYLLAFKEFENCYHDRKTHYGKKVVDSFKKLAHNYGTAYSKIDEKTERTLQMAIALEFSECIVNFYRIYNQVLMPALGMQPLPKEWLKPLLAKTKQALMSVDSTSKVEELYLQLENIGSEIGIPQY
ncbi:MAG: hypothetical protein HQM14_17935 [SAR324 cluster bacterium]|nr:hypothetical protein [SAR324 cluster bacterium]